MNVIVRSHSTGYPIYTIRAGENEFELSTFGGQLLSWTKVGVPILFANRERAIQDGKTPYRGGGPICFPYFSKGTLMPRGTTLAPQHGHARTTVWSAEVHDADDRIVLRTEQPTPYGYGPTVLSCELTYRFGDDLQIAARISDIGGNPSPFQFAVHSYWACEDPSHVTVAGLGERFLDNLHGYQAFTDPADSAPHQPPFDRVYPDAADELELVTSQYRLQVKTQNCPGAVLWNPGPDHPIADLGSPDFVCLESGVITPTASLSPGESCELDIAYRVASVNR